MLVESLAAASGPTSEEDGLEGSPLCWRTHNATPDIGQWTFHDVLSHQAAPRPATPHRPVPLNLHAATALEHLIISGYLLREKELLDWPLWRYQILLFYC